MNFKRSVEIALAMSGKKKTWLAAEIDISQSALSDRLRANNPQAESIDQIAGALKMKSSELIALGEV